MPDEFQVQLASGPSLSLTLALAHREPDVMSFEDTGGADRFTLLSLRSLGAVALGGASMLTELKIFCFQHRSVTFGTHAIRSLQSVPCLCLRTA